MDGGSPQALRTPPRGGRPALQSSRCRWLQVGLSVSRLSPSCLNSLSIPSAILWPVRNYPHLWISTRGHGSSGTSIHLKRALPGAHYTQLRPCAPHRYARLVGLPLGLFTLHRGDGFPRSTQELEPSSRRLHAGRHLGAKQAVSQTSPGLTITKPTRF